MTKQLLIFVFTVTSILCATAQSFTIGKPYPVIDGLKKSYFIEDGEILSLKVGAENVHLIKLSATELTSQQVKIYIDFPKGFHCERIAKFNGRYYLFYSFRENEKEKLACREIDFASGTFKNTGTLLISLDHEISGDMVAAGGLGGEVINKFNFIFSYDSASMLVKYSFKPENQKSVLVKFDDSNTYKKINLHLFDSNLSEKWSNEITMPYMEKQMNRFDYSVNSDGRVYIVIQVFDDKVKGLLKMVSKGEDNYHLEIIKIIPGKKDFTTIRVDTNEKFISVLRLAESVKSKGSMVCAGYYNNGSTKKKGADGVVLFEVNLDDKIQSQKYYPMPLEFQKLYPDKVSDIKGQRPEVINYDLLVPSQFVINRDESVVLIGEHTYVSVIYGEYGGYTHHCDDLFLTKISSDGNLSWMRKIPKRSSNGNSFFEDNYCRLLEQGYLSIMFLDNPDNASLLPSDVPKAQNNGILSLFKINFETGDVKRTTMLDTRKSINEMQLYQIVPSRFLSLTPNTFVFEAYKKNKENVLVKVVLD